MMNNLEHEIRTGFDQFRADEIREINLRIQRARDTLAHLLRRRSELLGRVEEIFNESPAGEQPGLDTILEKAA